ncbi:MAG: DUF2807 domain-containing protein [Bacteroidales bacterium]|nr:DUF2807 domain-containing protein [Bacteroidales bacterium]
MKRILLILVILLSAFWAKAGDTTQTKVYVIKFNEDVIFTDRLETDYNFDSIMNELEISLQDFEINHQNFELDMEDLDEQMKILQKKLSDTTSNLFNRDTLFQYLDLENFDVFYDTLRSKDYMKAKLLDSVFQLLNHQPFSLDADGFFNIIYTPSDTTELVKISADSKIIDHILVEETMKNGKNVLNIRYKDVVGNFTIPPTIYLYANDLDKIDINSASKFSTTAPIQAKTFTVHAKGASNVLIDGAFDVLQTRADGASNVVYKGNAKNHSITSNGASNVYASKQTNDTATLSASGVSKIKVYVKDKIISQDCNSYASIIVLGKPETFTDKDVTIIYNDADGNQIIHTQDTSTFKLLGIDFTNLNDKKYIIGFGSHEMISNGNQVNIQSRKGKKFNGHWGGIELGINGYNTPLFNMDFPKEYEYMDLRTSKSIAFHLNLIEFNIPFAKRQRLQKWGMVTGLGYEVHNYRLQSNVFLCPDSSVLKGYYVEGGLPVRSKLMVDYLTIPVLFEFQNKNFHVNLGGIFGLRLTTHSKMKFENPDETVFLNDPISGKAVATLTPEHKIYKQHDDFHLNPVKFNARLSIGYSILNVFVDYSVINMFRANQGPEFYPWTVGITLLGW